MSDTSTKGPLAMTTDRDDIASLLERVKAATGPDRDLDRSIWRHFNPRPAGRVSDVVLPQGFGKGALNDALDPTPMLTGSIDAALALVERLMPDWGVQTMSPAGGEYAACNMWLPPPDGGPKALWRRSSGKSVTLPLAILAALLTSLKENHP